ncbi:hypothetical protein K435DRAFT_782848 [Dendrothele bispora CBS 962.96]|uniref:Uncharacterized protein n=1 Tax=Dendrothele bispora (strain CBS 962.96) TaxID=1314807 RepID=A0A4S8LC72_DENBC|nr:hypothetical protein K435DRAFT_782848 [Dendrothele bispora CBS 962.96]
MSMMYFSLSTALYISWLRLPHRFSPHIHSLLRLMCRSSIMLIISFWSAMKGKALVEAQDHEIYKKVALSRAFINSYDLGKMQNLKLIFNTREGG